MSGLILDLDAYLRRIGYAAVPGRPSLTLLTALHEAHVAAVPFENLDILLGRPILLDLPSLQRKLVAARRGGYCFEQNTLFQAVLEHLGFTVTPLAARVRLGADGIRPRTHMLLRVDLSEGSFLADVGFGGEGPIHPVPLVADQETRVGLTGCRLRREGELWILEGNASGQWTDLHAFTLERHYPADYEMANHYTSTYPRSRFVQNLVVQRSWPDRRVVLRNDTLSCRSGRDLETTPIRSRGHLLEVLESHFGLSFPPETCFSRPELPS